MSKEKTVTINYGPSGELQEIFSVITKEFLPAENEQEATNHYSTQEIIQQISGLYTGDDLTPNTIYTLMKKAKFNLTCDNEMKLTWLMKKK